MNEQRFELAGDPAQGDPPSPALAIVPPHARRGVVVIHEIFGPSPEVDRVVGRLAKEGYAAIAPDLFFRGKLACIRAVFAAAKRGDDVAPVRQAVRARDWLTRQAGIPKERIAIIGFCFGGGFALVAGKHFGVVSANYGTTPELAALKGIAPTIGCYGGRDHSMRGQDRLLKERLTTLGVEHEIFKPEDAGHAFLTDGNRPVASFFTWPLMHVKIDPENAEAGWQRILRFFDEHLSERAEIQAE